MSPTTTEEKLEEELFESTSELDDIKMRIRSVQIELNKLQSMQVEYREKVDIKTEELRRFRLMYPSICKPPTK